MMIILWSLGVGILYKKKTPPPTNLFSFLSPLFMDDLCYPSVLMIILWSTNLFSFLSSCPLMTFVIPLY